MPTTQIHCLGLNHRTAPIELREMFAAPLIHPDIALFSDSYNLDVHEVRIDNGGRSAGGGCPYHANAHGTSKPRTSGEAVRDQRNASGNGSSKRARRRYPRKGTFVPIRELAMFATCNRMEAYAYVDASADDPKNLLLQFLSLVYDIDPEVMNGHFYHYRGIEAVAHLCKVACGLDSQVLGETQILGQVTGAYENALETVSAGPFIDALFRAAIHAGKRARTETTISSNPASMSSVAIATAQDVIGDLQDRTVLVVGMGEMGLLTIRALHARQLENIALANRSVERAKGIADHLGFRVYSLDELPDAIAEADVVISTTGAAGTVIDSSMVNAALENRGDRPLVIVDIAVPRDVEPAVGGLEGVHVFDADRLKVTLDRALEARKKEIPRVEEIIAEETTKCEIEMKETSLRPIITDLREKAESIRIGELERTLRQLPHVDSDTIEQIRRMSRAIVNKILHDPTVRLKRSARVGLHNEYSSAVRQLFDLPENSEG